MKQGCTDSAGTPIELQVARLWPEFRIDDHREMVIDPVLMSVGTFLYHVIFSELYGERSARCTRDNERGMQQ